MNAIEYYCKEVKLASLETFGGLFVNLIGGILLDFERKIKTLPHA